jgi:hypothetical protein
MYDLLRGRMIHKEGLQIKDQQGRTLMLRGVNLGGSSKVPSRPDGATHRLESFFDHRGVSFVGRPFPLDEADEHLARLKKWGFTFLRFLVTWEAIEHAGPGLYDEAYLDYLYQVVRRAGDFGFTLFIDPHQDVWSRFTGGDGAPGWTLEGAGIELTRLVSTGAAVVHNQYEGAFPAMIWPSNSGRFGSATMFTLFFGGSHFVPQLQIEGEPVQEFLQRHYIDAIKQVALRLKDLPHVVGYGTFNEPSAGYIGISDLNRPFGMLLKGPMPSPLQSMALASGIPQDVGLYTLGVTGFRRTGSRLVNPNQQKLWQAGRDCIWRAAGIWNVDRSGQPSLLQPDYFSHRGGQPVHFGRDYLKPFINRYAREIRSVDPDAIIFAEGTVDEGLPEWAPDDAKNIVNAPHWYDGMTLVTKRYTGWVGIDIDARRPVFGAENVRKAFARQLKVIKDMGQRLTGAPVLIGEFGIPFDLNKKAAYRSGDFRQHIQALDATFQALEANLLHSTLWNYTADNDNQWGDQWNEEDLSIFSRDQQKDPQDINSGGRALEAVVRPYPLACAGEPLRMKFDLKRRAFEFEFRHDPGLSAPTEIFVPDYQYPSGYTIRVSDGEYEIDRENQRLRYRPSNSYEVHTIRVLPSG